jgi:hypothetical protein
MAPVAIVRVSAAVAFFHPRDLPFSFFSWHYFLFDREINPAPENLTDDSSENKYGDISEVEMR